jgi:hypothetical protein
MVRERVPGTEDAVGVLHSQGTLSEYEQHTKVELVSIEDDKTETNCTR